MGSAAASGDIGLFVVSLVFGAGVIAFFARTQFLEPNAEASREVERLVRFLKTSDLRRPTVWWRAYAFYALVLITIYLVISSFFTLPMLAALGIGVSGEIESARSPVVPLTISLAMVGLAPGIPFLQRFEERVRVLAHYFSGIPTRLIEGSRELQRAELRLPRDQGGLLIAEADWRRLDHFTAAGGPILDDPDDFVSDLRKVIAYRAWILKHMIGNAVVAGRPGIERNDADLERRIEQAILALDILSNFDGGDTPGEASPPASKEMWEKVAQDVDRLAADVCGMIMLRHEQGMLVGHTPSEGATDDARAAEKTLAAFVARADTWVNHSHLVAKLTQHTTLVVLVIAFLWGAFMGHQEVSATVPGGAEVARQTAIMNGAQYALTAMMIYTVSVFIALFWRDQMLQAKRGDRWINMAATPWTQWLGQAAWIALCSVAATTAVVAAASMFQYFLAHGIEPSSYLPALGGVILTHGPRTVLGAVLALGVVAAIDVRAAGPAAPPRARYWVLGLTVGALAILSPLMQALYFDFRDTSNLQPCVDLYGAARCAIYDHDSLMALLQSYPVALALASIRAALIGAAVIGICQATLAGDRSTGATPRFLSRRRTA